MYATAITVFVEPNPIAPGGVTGIAIILNHIINVPVGTAIIIMNVPLLIIGFLKFKLDFIIKTGYAVIMSSVFIDIFTEILPSYTGDMLLSAMAGAVISGLGLALILMHGSTTGGTDIVVKLINAKYPFLSIGKAVLLLDGIVVVLNTFVVKNFESLLYSSVYIFIASVVMDKLIYGANIGKLLYIITENPLTITQRVMTDIGRGVTKIRAKGGYTEKDKTILLCAVRPSEILEIIRIVKAEDKNAFLIISEASEVLGLGFKSSYQ